MTSLSPPGYTYADHARRCGEAARQGIVLDATYVQLRIGQQLACARISELWTTPEGVDLWRVQLQPPHVGLYYVPCNRVRQCSGIDGRCTCAGETSTGREGAPACGGASRPVEASQSACSKNRQEGRDVLVTRHFSPVGRKNA